MNAVESFSEHEAPTKAVGDRLTPDFQAPSGLLRLAGVNPAEDSEVPEHSFWDSPPRYSTTSVVPAAPPVLAPPPASHRATPRRTLATVLFAMLFAGVLALLFYEASILLGAHWSKVGAAVANR